MMKIGFIMTACHYCGCTINGFDSRATMEHQSKCPQRKQFFEKMELFAKNAVQNINSWPNSKSVLYRKREL